MASIQILHFIQLNQVSPIYYDKAYHVILEAGGDKAFDLLRRTLMDALKANIEQNKPDKPKRRKKQGTWAFWNRAPC